MLFVGIHNYNPENAQLNNCTAIYNSTSSSFTVHSHCSHTPVYVCAGIMAVFHLFQVLIILPYSCSLDIRYVVLNTIFPSSIGFALTIICVFIYNSCIKNLITFIKMWFK